MVPVRVPSVTTSLVGGAPASPAAALLLALRRRRLSLARCGLLRPVGAASCSALGDPRTEQVAADDLHGHDHEQPQYGEKTQPHDREGQL